MRDRRLLLPALALLVALIAVPVLLKSSSSSSTTPSPPVASTGGGGATAAEPAVLAQRAGITSYRKRLDTLKSKNPFRQRVGLPRGGSGGSGSGASPTTVTGNSGSVPASSVTDASTSSSASSAPSTTSSAPSTTSSPSPSSTSGGTGAGSARGHRTVKWYSFRISLSVGPAGDLTRRDNVKRLALLPGENRPIVAFIGVSDDMKRAVFAVSKDVSSVGGEGRCSPRRNVCDFLMLKSGEKASLDYAPEGDRTFNLRLRRIELVPTRKPRGGRSAGKRGADEVLGPDGQSSARAR